MRIGSLFSGYGGLDQGVQAVLGGTVAWHSEVDKGACKVLAHRYPDVPNLGDITTVDWSAVEPVDVLTGGYPCQPFSHAGRRKGEADERHLWPYVREAVRCLRPRLTVLENVAGHRSMGFDRVLGDLAEDGLHVRWASVRASDVGAPHRRERLFIVVAANPADLGHERAGRARRRWPGPADGSLLPTPTAQDAAGSGGSTASDVTLVDAVVRTRMGTRPNERLLPTPTTGDGEGGGVKTGVTSESMLKSTGDGGTSRLRDTAGLPSDQWGQYADAIARWEHLTRPAPAPTMLSSKGTPQLSPAFSEWMLGLPAGWVTDVPGITRNEALKVLGNGVVWQQCEAALRYLLDVEAGAA